MSQAHKASRLIVQDATYAVPFESAHFNFNEDAIGIIYGDLTQPQGNAIYSMRPYEGKFGGAVAVEEATTNLAVGGALTTNYGTGVVVTSVVSGGQFDGWNKTTINTVNTTNSLLCYIGGYGIASGNTNPHSWSIDFFCPKGNIIPNINGTWGVGNATNVGGYRWEKNNYARPSGTAAGSIHWYPANQGNSVVAGDVFYWRNKQVEQKTFSTSHVSTSRVAGSLEYKNPIEGAKEFTISYWVKRIADVGANPLVVISGATDINGAYFDCNSGVRFFIYDSTATARVINTSDLVDGQWTHVAGVKSIDKIELFINGEKKSGLNISDANFSLTGTLQIGKRITTGAYSNMLIDELRIDRYAASEEEIASWYVSGEPFYNPFDYRALSY